MSETPAKPVVPVTPLLRFYLELKNNPGGSTMRRDEARRVAAAPQVLVEQFAASVQRVDEFFTAHPRADDRFYPKPRDLDRAPGLSSTPALGRLLSDDRARRWPVDDEDLSFLYVDRELTVTRAPGFLLEREDGGPPQTTRNGPSLDLLLRNAADDKPILAEVKIERDKDPFFALVQVLMAVAYLQPGPQRRRLGLHDPDFDLAEETLDAYLLLTKFEGDSGFWAEVLALTLQIAADVAGDLSQWVRRISVIDLSWDGQDPESLRGTRLS